jgi:hypothetical protein
MGEAVVMVRVADKRVFGTIEAVRLRLEVNAVINCTYCIARVRY